MQRFGIFVLQVVEVGKGVKLTITESKTYGIGVKGSKLKQFSSELNLISISKSNRFEER